MKFTFNLPSKRGQVTAQIHPYIGPCAEPPKWRDARAEITFYLNDDGMSDEQSCHEVVIEADKISPLRQALQDLLDCLEDLECMHREEVIDHAANAIQCSVCKTYYDKRLADIEHADGKGHTCNGDGTVWLVEQRVRRYVEGTSKPQDCNFRDLKAGDRFCTLGESGENQVSQVALADAENRFHWKHGKFPHAAWVIRVPYRK